MATRQHPLGGRSPSAQVARLAALALALFAGDAFGAGFTLPDNGTRAVARGGAFTVLADDLTAVHHNPAGLARLDGTHLLYNHSLIWGHASFTRQASRIPQQDVGYDQGNPTATVSNEAPFFPLGVMLAAASDFGLDDWMFALAVFGPNAAGSNEWPVDGGQRYMLTQVEPLLLHVNFSTGWRPHPDVGLGAGLAWVTMPSTKYKLVVDGIKNRTLNPYVSSSDVEATMDVSDAFSWTATLGAWWRIIPELEVAISGYVVPVKLEAEGDISIANVPNQTTFTAEELDVTNSSAAFDMTLPIILRAGLRYRHLDGEREVFDVEVDVVYEAWSAVEAFDVDLEGQINLYSGDQVQDVVIDKRWRDTLSVRAGGTWNVIADALDISLGGFWEQGAVPDAYSHLDFLSFERIGVGAGLTWSVAGYAFSVAYQHVFQEDRTVDEEFAKVFQLRPVFPCPENCGPGEGLSGVPSNAGKFESSFDTLAFGVEKAF